MALAINLYLSHDDDELLSSAIHHGAVPPICVVLILRSLCRRRRYSTPLRSSGRFILFSDVPWPLLLLLIALSSFRGQECTGLQTERRSTRSIRRIKHSSRQGRFQGHLSGLELTQSDLTRTPSLQSGSLFRGITVLVLPWNEKKT